MARVVGWTDEMPSLLVAGDDASSRTAITSLAPITSEGDAVNAATIRAIAVRNPFFGPVAGNNQVFRYVLPTDADPDELFVVGLDQVDIEEIAFWDRQSLGRRRRHARRHPGPRVGDPRRRRGRSAPMST